MGSTRAAPFNLAPSSVESLPAPYESLPGCHRVLAVLAGRPLPGREVARRAGLRWSETFRTLAALEEAGVVVHEGRARKSRWALVPTRAVTPASDPLMAAAREAIRTGRVPTWWSG